MANGPKMERDPTPEGPIVRGFRERGFLVSDRYVPGGLKLTPDDARDWTATDVATLTEADVADLLAMAPSPEFILIGTGRDMIRPPVAFVRAIEARGVGVEAMDSRAAARAWGVLRAEGRWIAAALLPL
ncbi:MAG: Mth938-like domain-containing protein [Sphingomonas sp.]|nr:Mth938-like domain-containing protein [Sphingomonas sp.]MDX3886311.1 Mth938-like domain-containing protein [Sphingomonas sp.]